MTTPKHRSRPRATTSVLEVDADLPHHRAERGSPSPTRPRPRAISSHHVGTDAGDLPHHPAERGSPSPPGSSSSPLSDSGDRSPLPTKHGDIEAGHGLLEGQGLPTRSRNVREEDTAASTSGIMGYFSWSKARVGSSASQSYARDARILKSRTKRFALAAICLVPLLILLVGCINPSFLYALRSKILRAGGKRGWKTDNHAGEFRPPPSCYLRHEVEAPLRENSQGQSSGAGSLPTLIFFAGIEGSGHHFMEAALRNVEEVPMMFTQFEPDLHLGAEDSQGETTLVTGTVGIKLPYSRLWPDFIREMSIRLGPLSAGGVYVRARDSYPMGRIRTPLARPDLINLSLLDGILYKLKVLVLVRNLTAVFTSVTRRGYHGGDLGLMARIMEDELVYLDASLRTLPCSSFMAVNFQHLLDSPEEVAWPLANFLNIGVSSHALVRALKKAKDQKPGHDSGSPMLGGDSVEEFFYRRREMWPLLDACSKVGYFLPLDESDWP